MILNLTNAAGLTVVVNGQSYTADANGNISVVLPIQANPMAAPVVVEVKNGTGAAVDVDYELEYVAGHMMNPIALNGMSGNATANTANGATVFYTWTAAYDGVLTVTGLTEGNWIEVGCAGVYADAIVDANGVATIEVLRGDTVEIAVGGFVDSVDFSFSFVSNELVLTGDSLATVLAVFAVSAIALVAVVALPKRKEER